MIFLSQGWIVGDMRWTMGVNGRVNIIRHGTRYYRKKEYAQERFDAVLDGYRDLGYKISPIASMDEYGKKLARHGYYRKPDGGRGSTVFVAVFMDENPG